MWIRFPVISRWYLVSSSRQTKALFTYKAHKRPLVYTSILPVIEANATATMTDVSMRNIATKKSQAKGHTQPLRLFVQPLLIMTHQYKQWWKNKQNISDPLSACHLIRYSLILISQHNLWQWLNVILYIHFVY